VGESAARTLQEFGQRRVFMYHALHRVCYCRMVRVVWLGVECRRVTQLVGRAFKCGESPGMVWRLATEMLASRLFVCFERSMCERYSWESHGGLKLSHS
jgi:hypothetical protein